MTTNLFAPLTLGPITLSNRVVMAPMTRSRADENRCVTDMVAEYYAQRASAGLIISEASQISREAIGYMGTPGMHTPEQGKAWRKVTGAVHDKGGRIYAQLWHCGRASHPYFQPDGKAPPAPSAVMPQSNARIDTGLVPRVMPRAMTLEEIATTIVDYRNAAKVALDAGFDGVELHGANGYLPDQFLRDGTNLRTDAYGGSIQNRARFMLEAARALVDVWGPGRVGVRLSPSGAFNDMRDTNPRETYGYVVRAMNDLPLAYLHIMEAMVDDATAGAAIPGWTSIPVSVFRPLYKGVIITNAGFTFAKANEYLARGDADAVAFGMPYIANPDLVERFRRFGADAPLAAVDSATIYRGGAAGYTTYPPLEAP